MVRKTLCVLSVAALFCAGCAKKAAHYQSAAAVDQSEPNRQGRVQQYLYARSSAGGGLGLDRISSAAMLDTSVFAAPRYVAVRHKLEIVEPVSGLPKSIEAVVAFCGSIQCEVLSSTVTNETAVLSPSGTIAARVAPQDLNKFLDFIGKQGKVAQHSTESEDKTATVVDVQAKIKNQTDFRDNLRKMLAKPGVSVADLLQIQEKLADAQSELDAEATQRKMLANETEKVYVEVAFRSEQRVVHRGAFASVGEAFSDSGTVLGDSLAALITAIAAILPWLLVIVPGIWVLVRFVRNYRRKRAERKAASLANSQSH